MNPYYSNWNYGYTLAPSSEQSRGAYNSFDQQQQQHQSNSQPTSAHTERQKFISASKDDSSAAPNPSIGPIKPELNQPSKDNDPYTSISRVHELAIANKLVERYETIDGGAAGDPKKVILYIGAEVYEGTGCNNKEAKMSAALMCLTNTKYQTAKEMKMTMFKTANRVGITATSELHELAAKKNIIVDFKFLEPYNFEFKASMRMWTKKEMLGNYRVQLNMAGYEFYGQAELPQQAKHNAATQALDVLRKMPANKGEGKVIAKPGKTPDELEKEEESTPVQSGGKNIMLLLNETAVTNNISPQWEMLSEAGPAHARSYTWQLTMGEFVTIGTGPNKKTAKQGAADQMWSTLPDDWKARAKHRLRRNNGGFQPYGVKRTAVDFPNFESVKKKPTVPGQKMEITANNPISSLYEFAKKKKIGDPSFTVVGENVIGETRVSKHHAVPFKKMEYTYECEIEGRKFRSTALNKKAAKTAVAMEAWDVIKRENNL